MVLSASAVVVDTDVASYIFKHDSRGEPFRPHLANRTLVLSFMGLAELHCWAIERRWGSRQQAVLAMYLERFVIFPFHPELCRIWAEVTVEARQRGRPISTADAWHASTAKANDLPLVTNNARDYAGVPGLVLLTT